jgi:hypothetical protein
MIPDASKTGIIAYLYRSSPPPVKFNHDEVIIPVVVTPVFKLRF